jgi:hypothetical protein
MLLSFTIFKYLGNIMLRKKEEYLHKQICHNLALLIIYGGAKQKQSSKNYKMVKNF